MQLLLLWHFHQPYYGFPGDESFVLPWVRLHATKSYIDMVSVLEGAPEVKVTANFSGSLLEQIDRYVSDGWRDRFWDLTLRPASELNAEDYHFMLRHFFSLDWHTVLPRFPRYGQLLEKRGYHESDTGQERFSDQEITDLQVLFNLAWCGFTLRNSDERVAGLVDQGQDFTDGDKAALMEAHIDALRQVVPRWRALIDRGQVELCVTPQYHPILPLLIDSDSARRAMPNHPMPARYQFPEDAARHIVAGLDRAERTFGTRPAGIWPSEGSVSPELLPLARQAGLAWMASDEHVLLSSDREGASGREGIYEPWWLDSDTLAGFFRDHELSDLIGFSYSRTPADKAVDDFVGRIRSVGEGAASGKRGKNAPPCVAVILDGENAWEHYPDDGRAFLRTLHEGLAAASDIETVTPSQRLAERPPRRSVTRLHSGSWISANFRIWIGTDAKNQAWTQLQHTRQFFEERISESPKPNPEAVERARLALSRAEGSDWFWWYGDDFSSDNDALFDELFRRNLIAVHEALGHPPPLLLEHPIDGHHKRPATVPPRSLIAPTIDGDMAPYLDWVDAGRYEPTGAAGSMAQTSRYVDELRFGFDLEHLFILLDTSERVWSSAERPFVVRIELSTPDLDVRRTFYIPIIRQGELAPHDDAANGTTAAAGAVCEAHFGNCLEVAISFAGLGLRPGVELEFTCQLERGGVRLQRLPQTGPLRIEVPDETFEGRHWYV